jgi:hypothetical protein
VPKTLVQYPLVRPCSMSEQEHHEAIQDLAWRVEHALQDGNAAVADACLKVLDKLIDCCFTSMAINN